MLVASGAALEEDKSKTAARRRRLRREMLIILAVEVQYLDFFHGPIFIPRRETLRLK